MKLTTEKIEVFQAIMKVLADLFVEGKIVMSSPVLACGIAKDRTSMFAVNFAENFFSKEGKDVVVGVNFEDVAKGVARFRGASKLTIYSSDGKLLSMKSTNDVLKKVIALRGYTADSIERVDMEYVNNVVSETLTHSILQVELGGEDFKSLVGDIMGISEELTIRGDKEGRRIEFSSASDSGSIEYGRTIQLEEKEFILVDFVKRFRIEALKEFERAGWIQDFKVNLGDKCMLISADVHDKAKKKKNEEVIGRIFLVLSSKARELK